MRLLLDTHVLIWTLTGARLSTPARTAIRDPHNTTLASAASLWEMSIKAGLGRLDVPDDLLTAMAEQDIGVLDITAQHALGVNALPHHHRDPFDRMLIAQAGIEDLVLVTRDAQIREYDINTLAA